MRVAIASDHAGFDVKEAVRRALEVEGVPVEDLGPPSADSVDYPDFAHAVAGRIERGEMDRAILVCGSGQGMAMSANRHKGVRAALAWDVESARLSRQHNDANIVALPGRRVTTEQALAIVRAFLSTGFEGGRHTGRVAKIDSD